MGKVDPRSVLTAIFTATAIPLAHGLRSVGAADWVVGLFDGVCIGTSLILVVIATRAKAARG